MWYNKTIKLTWSDVVKSFLARNKLSRARHRGRSHVCLLRWLIYYPTMLWYKYSTLYMLEQSKVTICSRTIVEPTVCTNSWLKCIGHVSMSRAYADQWTISGNYKGYSWRSCTTDAYTYFYRTFIKEQCAKVKDV